LQSQVNRLAFVIEVMGGLGRGCPEVKGGDRVKALENVPTDRLWEAIEHNAQSALRHVNWVEYLDNIKVLCALIDERIQSHQRRMRLEQVYREHRGVFRLSGGDEADAGGLQRAAGAAQSAASRAGGDGREV